MTHDLIQLEGVPDDYAPIEVRLFSPEDFLKVKETLTRMGVASKKTNTLYQSCHILHKRQRYFIVTFKELFALDGKPTNITENDLARRNTIASLLEGWGLVEIVDPSICVIKAPLSQIKIIPFSKKREWVLESKYGIGQKRH